MEDVIVGVNQYDARLPEVHVGVVALQHVEDEIVRVGRGFYPGGASADEDEGEQALRQFPAQSLGLLETVDHLVAYPKGIAQSLGVHGVLRSAGGAEEGRAAAWRQDKIVVGEGPLLRLYFAGFEVRSCHLILKRSEEHT